MLYVMIIRIYFLNLPSAEENRSGDPFGEGKVARWQGGKVESGQRGRREKNVKQKVN